MKLALVKSLAVAAVATLPLMAGHVLAVTALGVAFVATGVALRFGGF